MWTLEVHECIYNDGCNSYHFIYGAVTCDIRTASRGFYAGENSSFVVRKEEILIREACGSDMSEEKLLRMIFASNNIIRAVNQYRLIQNLIQNNPIHMNTQEMY
ncbi:unnamed protein product [Coffea canephora]|uniref:DH200=94 genomic scaffold, scaffold_177 n=1 Tax=Coffea canephora TaxID=49390 RepID=A0A068VB14_COFCA|nr:unnamed protein product [Coffea canephora]